MYKSQRIISCFLDSISFTSPTPFPFFCYLILITGTKCQEEILLLESYNKLTDFSLLECTAVQYRLCAKKKLLEILYKELKDPFGFCSQ